MNGFLINLNKKSLIILNNMIFYFLYVNIVNFKYKNKFQLNNLN